MSDNINNIFENIPLITELPVEMNYPNEIIKIYEGKYVLINDEKEIKLKGIIEYHWFPEKGAVFKGNILSELDFNLDSSKEFSLLINNLDSGKVFITNRKIGHKTDEFEFKGVFIKDFVLGDSSIEVKEISFSLANFKELHGSPVKRVLKENITTSQNRIIFKNENYKLVLDKLIDYSVRKEDLKLSGGYLLLYSGKLLLNKSLNLEKAKSFFSCINSFLSFLNGRRVETTFLQGSFQNEILWTDYSNYSFEIFKQATSWTMSRFDNEMNDVFVNFSNLWKNENDRNFLKSVIHWYIESNNNSGKVEGSIIMAQTALELIYNWLVVERKKLIKGGDANNISAANKIRLLLSQLSINSEVPGSFSNLNELIQQSSEYSDAPDVIVQIRNAIIHSQMDKRNKITTLSLDLKYEVLDLCIWYIEMSILYILNYKGKYINRCNKNLYPSNRIEKVPWL